MEEIRKKLSGDIVVVEDNLGNLRLMTSLLAEEGYKVRPAPTGEHALKAITKNPPDLILLDIMLPDLSGYDVCQRLQQEEATRHIPIIFLSALGEVKDKMKGFEVGGVDYITKPFHTDEVLARVATHLKIRRLQEDLFEEMSRFKTLTEAAFESIIIHSDEQILDVNQEAVMLLGRGENELQGNNLLQILPPQFHGVVTLEEKGPIQGILDSSDHTSPIVEIRTRSLSIKERPMSVTAIRDITREKRFEQEKNRLEEENSALKTSIQDRYKLGELIGRSPAMQAVYELIVKAAASSYSVVITGESGTGKELTARTVHDLSSRRNESFVTVNCGAVTESLFEREFFGHRKGAFTDAIRDEPGYLDTATNGTLFLDEISEMPVTLQVKLLRVLENGEYIPVGDSIAKKANVRIVVATNKNLLEMVHRGGFREDLYYRIHVIEIPLPPLRKRREDIRLLVEHFLSQDGSNDNIANLPDGLRQMLYDHGWPGNVRELKNAVQRYLATDDLAFRDSQDNRLGSGVKLENGLKSALDTLEEKMIVKALEQTNWHRGKTAELLHIPRRTLQRKINKYQLTY